MLSQIFNPDESLYLTLLNQLVTRLEPDQPELVRSDENICDAADWIEQNFYIEETFSPIVLHPYQRACLREATRRADGKFVYDLVLWSDIKKSAKSTIAAAVVLWRAFNKPRGKFRIVANDQKQAMSRVFEYIKICLQLNRELGQRATVNKLVITLDNGSTIEAVAVDPKGEAGGADDMVEYTELHAATSHAAVLMWAETALSPLKHGYSQRWVDTYAGHIGEAPVLEPLYEAGVRNGKRIYLPDCPPEVATYTADGMFVLWNTVQGLLPWQTREYYASEERNNIPMEYRRMHGNEWGSSVDAFVQPEQWDRCKGIYPEFQDTTPIIMGMDAGVSNDYFALVAVSRIADKVYVRFVYVYKPPVGGKINFEAVEKEIRELCKKYNIIQICYDPHELHDMSTRLKRDGVTWMYEFSQGSDRLVADKKLYDSILNLDIVHDGNEELAHCVKNANAQIDPRDHTLRIVKRSDTLKIDAAVALSMANHEAKRLNIF